MEAIVAKSKNVREIISYRCEMAALGKNDDWVERRKFVLNYFCFKRIDIWQPNTAWNDEMENYLQKAFQHYTTNHSAIMQKQALETNRDNENWEFELVDENSPGSMEALCKAAEEDDDE